jgi:hypothetical protein
VQCALDSPSLRIGPPGAWRPGPPRYASASAVERPWSCSGRARLAHRTRPCEVVSQKTSHSARVPHPGRAARRSRRAAQPRGLLLELALLGLELAQGRRPLPVVPLRSAPVQPRPLGRRLRGPGAARGAPRLALAHERTARRLPLRRRSRWPPVGASHPLPHPLPRPLERRRLPRGRALRRGGLGRRRARREQRRHPQLHLWRHLRRARRPRGVPRRRGARAVRRPAARPARLLAARARLLGAQLGG